jgi:predicted metal-dependent hydrolase
MTQLALGDIVLEVVQKEIKNVHLSVHPPDGRVTIAAPQEMALDTIRVFALTKLPWIRKQQEKFRHQEREVSRDFISNESHFFLGKRYLLKVIEKQRKAEVVQKHNVLELHIKSESSPEQKRVVLEQWYRTQLKEVALPLIQKWEKRMNVHVQELGIKKMKTKWGTCKIEDQRIWLNLELAKKPLDCIEYVIVHEMVHLLERNHNERFIAHLDQWLPNWRTVKEEINRLHVEYIRKGSQ